MQNIDEVVEKVKNTPAYFVYSADGKEFYKMCFGIEELSYFLNRQKGRVEKDLERARKMRKEENKLIKNKQGLKFKILSEKEMSKRSDLNV